MKCGREQTVKRDRARERTICQSQRRPPPPFPKGSLANFSLQGPHFCPFAFHRGEEDIPTLASWWLNHAREQNVKPFINMEKINRQFYCLSPFSLWYPKSLEIAPKYVMSAVGMYAGSGQKNSPGMNVLPSFLPSHCPFGAIRILFCDDDDHDMTNSKQATCVRLSLLHCLTNRWAYFFGEYWIRKILEKPNDAKM